jgi:hypothetical protein
MAVGVPVVVMVQTSFAAAPPVGEATPTRPIWRMSRISS